MANDIKIRIVSDNESAVKSIEELAGAFDDKLIPSISDATKSIKRAMRENEDVARSVDAYRKALEGQVASIIASTDGSKKYADSMKLVQKEANKMLSIGLVDMYKELLDVVGQLNDEYGKASKVEEDARKDAEAKRELAEAWAEAEKNAFAYFDTVEKKAEETRLKNATSRISDTQLKGIAGIAEINAFDWFDRAEAAAREQSKMVEATWDEAMEKAMSYFDNVESETIQANETIRNNVADFWDTFKETGLAAEEAEQKSLDIQIQQREKLLETQQKLYQTLKSTYEQDMKTQALNALNTPSTYGTKASKNKESLVGSLFGGKASASLVGFGAKMLSTVKNIMLFRTVMTLTNNVVRGFTNLMGDSTKSAAEAEQIFSKLNTVFGEYSGAMERASELSYKIGVSASTAASALSTVGDLLQAQGAGTVESLEMATEWVEQFEDIIAFKDIDMSLEEFAQNFMSGAAGNLRNFRTFGSIVKESAVNARLAAKGMDQLTGSELELAKMTTRAEIALEQQKNAIGATEREWDTMLSIQRRYDESMKTFKENVGQALQPVTTGWTKLKTSIVEAMNQYVAAEKMMADPDSAPTPVLSLNYDGSSSYNEKNVKGMLNQLMGLGSGEVDKIRTVLNQYGATLNDLEYAFDNFSTAFRDDDFMDVAKGIAAANDGVKELEKRTEESAKSFSVLVESTDKLFENMQSIDNVNFVGSEWYKSIQEMFSRKGEIGGDAILDLTGPLTQGVSEAITEALSDIGGIAPSEFGSLFGTETIGTALERQIEAYKSLYQVVMNNAYTSEEDLSLIVTNWQTATDELKKYTDQLKLVEDVNKAIANGFDGGAGNNLETSKLVDRYMEQGMSEDYAKAYVSALQLYEATKKQAEAIEDSKKRSDAIDAANKQWMKDSEQIAKYYGYIAKKAEETAAAEKEAQRYNDRLDLLKGYTSQTDDYAYQLQTFKLSEEDRTLYDLTQKMNEAFVSGDMSLYYTILETRDAFSDLVDAQKEYEKELEMSEVWNGIRDRAYGMTGFVGSTVQTFTDGQGDIWTDIITVVMDLLDKTGDFSELIETIDSFIQPLIYFLGDFVHMLGSIINPILKFLHPILKEVAVAFTVITGVVDVMASAIFDFIDNLSHPLKWKWNGTTSAYDTMLETVKKIREDTFGIEQNTRNDYGTYADLLRNKYITSEQYATLVGGNKYSSSTAMGSAIMTTGGNSNATYITINGMTVEGIGDGEAFVQYMSDYNRGVVAHRYG